MYKMLLIVAALGAMMMHAQAAEPMQAVEAVGAQDVYLVISFAVPNMDTFKPIVDKVVAASEQEPGTITYAYMMTPDKKRVDLIMRFKDSDAALAHVKMFGQQYAKDYFAAAKLESFVVYGDASDDLKKALADNKPTYMEPLAGFLSK